MFDPLFDVAPPEAEVFTDPKPQWPFASVAPCIDGGHRHTEIVGEFLDGEEPFVVFHARDDGWAPSQLTLIQPPSG